MNARISLDKEKSSFTTKLVRPEGVGTWTFAPIPADISGQAGLKARMRVSGTIDGVPVKSSLVAGSGELFIVIAKELRDKIGKQAGDVVKMTFGLDTSNSAVKVPTDLKKALSTNEKAKNSFEKMAPSHRKAYVQWITQAKTTETRANRIGKAIQQISVGKKLK
ncbi:MAG TPA: YdeI/OmpD-associated family protein [Candidatus Bathyarchaeia archaeon]|nr:YdeI/OmpD-associated family protein [Candidatus Bathyarchaeia archaeon]